VHNKVQYTFYSCKSKLQFRFQKEIIFLLCTLTHNHAYILETIKIEDVDQISLLKPMTFL